MNLIYYLRLPKMNLLSKDYINQRIISIFMKYG